MKNIILLHGAIGAAAQLEPLANALKDKQFSVHAFNFSGHGKMPFQQQFSIGQFASELEQFIKEHDLEQPAVFGYSMGGYVALHLEKLKPGTLGPVITLGTKFAWSPETAQKEIKMLDAKIILEKVPKFAEALKNRHGAEWEALLQKTAGMMLELGTNPALTETDFAAIENKVLVGLADQDAMVTLDETVAVFKQLKQADMYMLPESKHPIESVNVALLVNVIENCLLR